MIPLRRPALLLAALCALVLSACSAGGGSSSGKPSVVVGFYPQQFLAQWIGGDHVEVTTLVRQGADPHESELSAQQVAAVAGADLVVYTAGFVPSLDDAISNEEPAAVVDLSSIGERADDHDHAGDSQHDGGDHAGDPHAWQDPLLMKEMADQVAEHLADIDPVNADAYQSALTGLHSELDELDAEFRSGLQQCERTVFVTTHTAFGYLADAYGLTQLGITGLSAEQQPSAARLGEVKEFVEEHGVTTIFYGDTASPKYADTIAEATGATTAVLYPLESKPEVGDYIAGMTANLAALRLALGCG